MRCVYVYCLCVCACVRACAWVSEWLRVRARLRTRTPTQRLTSPLETPQKDRQTPPPGGKTATAQSEAPTHRVYEVGHRRTKIVFVGNAHTAPLYAHTDTYPLPPPTYTHRHAQGLTSLFKHHRRIARLRPLEARLPLRSLRPLPTASMRWGTAAQRLCLWAM